MSDQTYVPIPRVKFIDQKTGDISREWYLLLLAIVHRLGGPNGPSMDDVFLSLLGNNSVVSSVDQDYTGSESSPNTPEVQPEALAPVSMSEIEALISLITGANTSPQPNPPSYLPEWGPSVVIPEYRAVLEGPPPPDYSMPDDWALLPKVFVGTLGEQMSDRVRISGGSIDGTTLGATTPSSASVTTFTASSTVTLSPANANVTVSPTGTGNVVIAPATAGTIDNMTIGATTPRPITATTGTFSGILDVRAIYGIFGTNVAAAGQGGNTRFRNDTGAVNWLCGIPGAAASTSFHVFDLIAGAARLTINAAGQVTLGIGLTVPGGAQFVTTNTALTNGAAAAVGTLNNAPAAGNPTKWVGINDNGTLRYIPAW